jgi:hypothetical protein
MNQSSALVEISKLNGDFRENYGKLIGAFLYLRSISGAPLWHLTIIDLSAPSSGYGACRVQTNHRVLSTVSDRRGQTNSVSKKPFRL